MSFRDNLQHLRAERNMTQEQLAMLLGGLAPVRHQMGSGALVPGSVEL